LECASSQALKIEVKRDLASSLRPPVNDGRTQTKNVDLRDTYCPT
jgi:hypothetical protein